MGKPLTRRDFLSATAASLATAASTGISGVNAAEKSGLKLRAAGYRFPRTEPLFTGQVQVKGAETQFSEAAIGDINTEILGGPQSLDFAEIGLHPFMLAWANDGFRDYSLVPVYPLRLFRHKSIFIRNDRGIESPEDLRGKRIATPGYSSTSLTWIRGMLQDEYGLKPADVEWVTSARDSSANVAGSTSAQESRVPAGISMVQGPPGMDESQLLVAGDVDALFHAAVPQAFIEGHPRVARLFGDSRAVEQAYYRKTGIFPVMHAVAVRRSLLDEHDWLAAAIFNAYSRAKQVAYQQMIRIGWGADMLPWYGQEMEATTEIMGANFYSYGLPNNRKPLETLMRYSYEQGLSSRRLDVDLLFHPTALALTE